MNGGFKYHCGSCLSEWEPGPTTFCPRCGATSVMAGPSPNALQRAPDKGSNWSYVWIGLAVIVLFFMFLFAGCSRLFVPHARPAQH